MMEKDTHSQIILALCDVLRTLTSHLVTEAKQARTPSFTYYRTS